MTRLAALLPGLGLSLAVALASYWGEAAMLGSFGLRVPAIVIALVLGMCLVTFAARKTFAPGLTYAVKKLLRYAIALLGLRASISDIVGLGWTTALIVVASMAFTVVAGVWAARRFGRSDAYGALVGGATAVCGASAALAISTVIPNSPERDADTAFTVLAVNALATLAMLAYPLIATALHFSDHATGILLGATIHDVAQVVGAGYAVSDAAGNVAVIVKLFRVFLLLPVVLAIGWHFARQGGGTSDARVPVPVFALVFLGLALVNSFVAGNSALAPFYVPLKLWLGEASRWGLLVAIAALGLGTSARMIFTIGWGHIATVGVATLAILAFVLAAQVLTA